MMSDPTHPPLPSIIEWFTDQVPNHWFDHPLDIRIDRDEILVVGTLGCPEGHGLPGAPDGQSALLEHAHIHEFRESTRAVRVEIARRAQVVFERSVSWGAICGSTGMGFTTLSTPVMTRLRIDERQVLDTLVAGGVARSRSDALAWCVRLVAEHEGEWITDLRDALSTVEAVRSRRT